MSLAWGDHVTVGSQRPVVNPQSSPRVCGSADAVCWFALGVFLRFEAI